MKRRSPALLLLIGLMACHPAPKTAPVAQGLPAPKIAGDVRLYAVTDSVEAQVRNGDCTHEDCVVFSKKRWRPLKAKEATQQALLGLTMPVASAYSPHLFRDIGEGTDGASVMINTAAAQPAETGLFDGLRIGLAQADSVTYFTAYAVEAMATPGAIKMAEHAWLSPVDADVVITGHKAWLLQRRPDRSANLVDLLAVPKGPVLCLPGLIIDTEGQWAGPPEVALSPDLFISRAKSGPALETHKQQVLAACAEKAKAIP